MYKNRNIFKNIMLVLIIMLNSFVPFFIWPFGSDYFYYPKILMIYFLVCSLLAIGILSLRAGSLKLKYSGELMPIILFMAAILMSALFSDYIKQAFLGAYLRYEGALAYIAYFVTFYFSCILIDDNREIYKIFKFILVFAFIISIYSILQYFGIEFLPRDEVRKEWIFVSFGTVGNPNFLGSYLSIVFPISVCLYIEEKRKAQNIILLILSLVLYSAIVCTKTRSVWLGTSSSLLILFIIYFKKIHLYFKKISVLVLTFILAAMLLNAVHNGMISNRFNSIISDYKAIVSDDENKLHAGSERIFIWHRTMEYIFDNPLLGSGPDTFDKVFNMSQEEALKYFGSSNIYVDKAHNEYLQIAVTMGFPALMFYISFLGMLVYRTVLNIRNGKNTTITVGLFCGMLAYIIQAFFNISVVSVAPLYWSVLGLLMASNNIKGPLY